MRFQKNSFIFLETILSVFILSFIVAVFIKISPTKESSQLQLNAIHNQFKTKQHDKNFKILNETITFIKNTNDTLTIPVKTITFDNNKVKLVQYEN